MVGVHDINPDSSSITIPSGAESKEKVSISPDGFRRSSSSVSANLVEGFSRKSKKESLHFYNIADASLSELRYHILLSFDLGYINMDIFNNIENDILEIGRMLNGWISNSRRKNVLIRL